MKLVSVVVQAYNSEDTICDTVESIKAQTYSNIELIISDDKSKDNTVEIARAWVEKNRHAFTEVKVITTEKNSGIPGNNNRALKHVTGEYVEFLAADDKMLPDAVAEYVNFCEKNPKVIPIAKVQLFSEEACDFSSVQDYCDRCYAFAKLAYKEQYRQRLMQNTVVAPAAAFYPMELMREIKGFDEAYRCFEDYPVNLKLMKRGYRFGLLDKELIGYRISAKSITGSFFREKMWYMILAGMGWEAVKQSRYWIKMALKKG